MGNTPSPPASPGDLEDLDTLKERRVLLSKLIDRRSNRRVEAGQKDEVLPMIVYILEHSPELAYESFPMPSTHTAADVGASPFCYLLACRAALQMIQTAFRGLEDPGRLLTTKHGKDQNLLLHLACRYGADHDVIEFLAQKSPDEVTRTVNRDNELPLHCVMRPQSYLVQPMYRHPSLETIKLLVNMFPEGLYYREKVYDHTPMELALHWNLDEESISYIADTFCTHAPSPIDAFEIKSVFMGQASSIKVDMGQAKGMSQLLSRLSLKRFQIDALRWTEEGFQHLVKAIETNESVRDLCLTVPSSLLRSKVEVRDTLQQALQNRSNIRQITLTARQPPGQYGCDTALLQAIELALARNSTDGRWSDLKALHIKDFLLRGETSGQIWANFFASGSPPKKLIMERVFVEGPWQDPPRPLMEARLEHLELDGCVMDPVFWKLFLGFLAHQVPTLRHLGLNFLTHRGFDTSRNKLRDSFTADYHVSWYERRGAFESEKKLFCKLSGFDMTESLVTLLNGTQLKSLAVCVGSYTEYLGAPTVKGPTVDMEQLSACLKTNRSLLELDISADSADWSFVLNALAHNSTLKKVNGCKDRVIQRQMAYYLLLNQYGRDKVTRHGEHNTTKADFVGLLSAVLNNHSLIYGLLIEAPSLWCD